MIGKIQHFLDLYYPEYVPSHGPAYPAAPAAAYPAVPAVYNPLIINQVAAPAAAPAPEERQDRKPSGGQVLAAAGILTTGAVALSYMWHDGQWLSEMVELRKELEGAVVEATPNDATIYNGMLRLLNLEIDYATRSRTSKLLGTGSLSLTAAGAAVVTDFLISTIGLVGLAVSCGSFVVWANNYFDRRKHAKQRTILIRAIRSALNPPGQAYAPHGQAYAPPDQAYKPSAPL